MKLENLRKLKVGDPILYKSLITEDVYNGTIISIDISCRSCSRIQEGTCVGYINIKDNDGNFDDQTIQRCGKEDGWSLIDIVIDFISEEEMMI